MDTGVNFMFSIFLPNLFLFFSILRDPYLLNTQPLPTAFTPYPHRERILPPLQCKVRIILFLQLFICIPQEIRISTSVRHAFFYRLISQGFDLARAQAIPMPVFMLPTQAESLVKKCVLLVGSHFCQNT